MRGLRLISFVLLTLVALIASERQAPPAEASGGYIIVNLADTNDVAPGTGGLSYSGFGLDSPPNVNNAAEVAFQGTSGGPSFASGLFKASPVAADALVVLQGDVAPGTSGGTFNPHFNFGMNDDGDVAFWDGVTGGSYSDGIFLATSSGITARVLAPNDTFLGVGPVCDGLPFNAAGQIAFYGTQFMGGLNYQNGIYLDGAIIAEALNRNYAIGREALNDSGQVAYFDGRAMVGGGEVEALSPRRATPRLAQVEARSTSRRRPFVAQLSSLLSSTTPERSRSQPLCKTGIQVGEYSPASEVSPARSSS